MKRVKVNGEWFDRMITEEQIKKRIVELGKRIYDEHKHTTPIFIGVLNGAYIFLADIMREYYGECEMDFVKLSSYGDSKISSGNVNLVKDFSAKIDGRHVIIVEDIIDSGLSISFVRNLFLSHNPASLKVASFLNKKDVAKVDFPIDYVAFEISKEFVIGYGLDYAQKARNLKDVYVLSPDQKD